MTKMFGVNTFSIIAYVWKRRNSPSAIVVYVSFYHKFKVGRPSTEENDFEVLLCVVSG